MHSDQTPIAVYVHVPFCPSKCGYCDFNSYAPTGKGMPVDIVNRTTQAQLREIEQSPWRGRPAKTIFFGGGTPTFLRSDQLSSLLSAVLEVHPLVAGAEITTEANPGTVDAEKFDDLRAAGFNRLSIGAQSFLESDLITLGRVHRVGEIERAVGAARGAGFDNINLDLMFALPGQSSRAWMANVERAISLKPEHLSLYCLTIEPNTAFYKLHHHGQLVLPEEETQVEMYEACRSRVAEAGYAQYEISNFALPGRECAHNLAYWRGDEYAAYGPGAVGCVNTQLGSRMRWTNLKGPVAYCEAVEKGHPLAFESELLTDENIRLERIMLGLRLNAGLPREGLPLDLARLGDLEQRGWITATTATITLTELGQHFCSEVALALA